MNEVKKFELEELINVEKCEKVLKVFKYVFEFSCKIKTYKLNSSMNLLVFFIFLLCKVVSESSLRKD